MPRCDVDNSEFEMSDRIVRGDYFIPATVSSACASLITKLLDVDPLRRYTLDQVLKHPWINPTPHVSNLQITPRVSQLSTTSRLRAHSVVTQPAPRAHILANTSECHNNIAQRRVHTRTLTPSPPPPAKRKFLGSVLREFFAVHFAPLHASKRNESINNNQSEEEEFDAPVIPRFKSKLLK